jgi:hypothetical protein
VDVWREKGKIDEVRNTALQEIFAPSKFLHGDALLDLIEPAPSASDVGEERPVDFRRGIVEHKFGLDPSAAQGEDACEAKSSGIDPI